MPNHHGPAIPDVVTWEFTLNDGKQSDLFEAFVRQNTLLGEGGNWPMRSMEDSMFTV